MMIRVIKMCPHILLVLKKKNYYDFYFTTPGRRNSSGKTISDVVLEVGVEVGEN